MIHPTDPGWPRPGTQSPPLDIRDAGEELLGARYQWLPTSGNATQRRAHRTPIVEIGTGSTQTPSWKS